jgi:16S rRNA (guanine527-N7)-methyltransferase|tara:strand:+ start:1020 stop:1706 length:687 start_codon:yes stop_codon:yes gene_type:complete
LAWQPSSHQLQQFHRLQDLLREWNGRVNLTRLVEGEDYWISQIFDSLWPLQPWLSDSAALKVVDVGTGGGFPGLAIAIALPEAEVTLVDSVGRKVQAVQAMAETLGLASRVQLRCERAEKTGRDPNCRQYFQLAVARAVAAAPVVAEYLVPLLSPDGTALMYRGQWNNEDQRQLQRAAAQLNASTEAIQVQELPAARGRRHVIPLRPKGACPRQYPRAVGVPAKQPLA